MNWVSPWYSIPSPRQWPSRAPCEEEGPVRCGSSSQGTHSFYAEMGSVNPVFILPELRLSGEAIAQQYVNRSPWGRAVHQSGPPDRMEGAF